MSAAEAPVGDAEADVLFVDLQSSKGIVLAVSGGPDSTALMWLAARWRDRHDPAPPLFAVTIDHGLRPEAAREATAVKRSAAHLGLPHRTLRWSEPKPATGLQEAAREARYRLLAAAARKADAQHILTAHTLDDQAETVLFRLARGSGLTGLSGMARVSPLPASVRGVSRVRESGMGEILLVRPLLDIPKARLIATLEAAGIPFAQDPSNEDPRFTRTRLRRLMPSLAAEGLDAHRLGLLARRLRRADRAVEAAVTEAVQRLSPRAWREGEPIRLDAAGFAKLPDEIALRLLGKAIDLAGDEGSVELAKLETLLAAVRAYDRAGDRARLRRTLAGAVVTLLGDRMVVERAQPRRLAAARRFGRAEARRA